MTAASPQLQPLPERSKLDPLQALVETDMQRVNQLIVARLDSPIRLIPELAGHLVAAGGKRVRPMLTLITRAALRLSRRAPHPPRGGGRVHPQRDAAARRRGRPERAASRPRDRQCDLGQQARGAGRRLPVRARLPADGRGRLARGPGGARQRLGGDRRGRGRAADDRQRRQDHRGSYLEVVGARPRRCSPPRPRSARWSPSGRRPRPRRCATTA